MHINIPRNPRHQLRPRLPKVRRLENVGRKIVRLVAFDGHIHGSRVCRRRLDHAHRPPLRHRFRRDVFPVLSTVAGKMHQPVIGACPDLALRYRRLHHRENRVVHLDAGVVLGDRTARCSLLRLIVTRQVRTDDCPAHPSIRRLEQHFACEIQRLRDRAAKIRSAPSTGNGASRQQPPIRSG